MIFQQENHILELSSSNLKKPARNLHQLLQLPGLFSSNKDLIHSFCSQNTHFALKTEKKLNQNAVRTSSLLVECVTKIKRVVWPRNLPFKNLGQISRSHTIN